MALPYVKHIEVTLNPIIYGSTTLKLTPKFSILRAGTAGSREVLDQTRNVAKEHQLLHTNIS